MLLARVLDLPELPARVRALPGQALGKLIGRVGLEDAAELVALASTEQLSQIFDEDLWRSDVAGVDERFDDDRFVLWLEIMLEGSEDATAERLAELSPDLLTLALHRKLLVLSEAVLREELTEREDGELAEKLLSNCLSEELDEFSVIWRGGEGWDSVLAALLALDKLDHGRLMEVVERCAELSSAELEEHDGLYSVLGAAETLEEDLAAERETRRAARGYVSPSSARAFLRLCRLPGTEQPPATEHDSLTRAYLRELAPGAPSPLRRAPALPGKTEPSAIPLASRALRLLGSRGSAAVQARTDELSYLVNVLMAGCTVHGRRLRPVEAVEHVLDLVSLGLGLQLGAADPGPEQAADLLENYPADGLWRLVCQAIGQRKPPRQVDSAAFERARGLLNAMKV